MVVSVVLLLVGAATKTNLMQVAPFLGRTAMGWIVDMATVGVAAVFAIYMQVRRHQQRLELDKVQAEESSRAKTTFLFNMSHDIRTPMNAIIGYTTLAKREDNSRERVEEYLDKIEASSQHMLSLINDVLETLTEVLSGQ